ncbi:MAG: glycosyltransferase family 2 protein [Actinobacteria bacterium]|nr:glycosyltransferase family 2 protein [Actinomycetota bacterium]MBI3686746.1 glycosyltransferase family 2 protein [Actinomycetota bacterium]
MRYSVVVVSAGRRSLQVLVDSLATGAGTLPEQVVVVDARQGDNDGLSLVVPWRVRHRLVVVPTSGPGAGSARNAGWQATGTPWVVFLDDQAVLPTDWTDRLVQDLAVLTPDVAGSQARIRVPLPKNRPPTDAERDAATAVTTRWCGTDIAYRRTVMSDLGGFAEEFEHRSAACVDLALRAITAGYRMAVGSREAVRPVRTTGPVSQPSEADQTLLIRRHAGGPAAVTMTLAELGLGAGRAGQPAALPHSAAPVG